MFFFGRVGLGWVNLGWATSFVYIVSFIKWRTKVPVMSSEILSFLFSDVDDWRIPVLSSEFTVTIYWAAVTLYLFSRMKQVASITQANSCFWCIPNGFFFCNYAWHGNCNRNCYTTISQTETFSLAVLIVVRSAGMHFGSCLAASRW